MEDDWLQCQRPDTEFNSLWIFKVDPFHSLWWCPSWSCWINLLLQLVQLWMNYTKVILQCWSLRGLDDDNFSHGGIVDLAVSLMYVLNKTNPCWTERNELVFYLPCLLFACFVINFSVVTCVQGHACYSVPLWADFSCDNFSIFSHSSRHKWRFVWCDPYSSCDITSGFACINNEDLCQNQNQ